MRGFKAEPSRSSIEKRFKPFDECDMDPAAERGARGRSD